MARLSSIQSFVVTQLPCNSKLRSLTCKGPILSAHGNNSRKCLLSRFNRRAGHRGTYVTLHAGRCGNVEQEASQDSDNCNCQDGIFSRRRQTISRGHFVYRSAAYKA